MLELFSSSSSLQIASLREMCPVTRPEDLFLLPLSEQVCSLFLDQFALGDLNDCYMLYGPTLRPHVGRPTQQRLSMATTRYFARALDRLLDLADWDTEAAIGYANSEAQIRAKKILIFNEGIQDRIERSQKPKGLKDAPGKISHSSARRKWYVDGCQRLHHGIRERVFCHTTGRVIHVIRPEVENQPCLVGFSQGWAKSLMIYFYLAAHTTLHPEQYLPEVAFIVTRSELPETPGINKIFFKNHLSFTYTTVSSRPWHPTQVFFSTGSSMNLSSISQKRRGQLIGERAFWKLINGATLLVTEDDFDFEASFVPSRGGLPIQDLVTCSRFQKTTLRVPELPKTIIDILRGSIFQKPTGLLGRRTA